MNILMPQLGETVNEGTIAVWHVKVGDTVEKNQALLDVETDKAAVEVPAQEAGTITDIKVAEGEEVDVGTVLAILEVDGEEPTAEEIPEPAKPLAAPESVAQAQPVPAAPPPAVVPAQAAPAAMPPIAKVDADARLSPAVRRLLAEHSLNISAIQGTGKKGRITRQDVLAFIDSGGAAAPSVGVATARSTPMPTPAADTRSVIPFDKIRKLTADHMVMSKQTSPHVLQAVEVEYTAVDLVRKSVGPAWKAANGYSLTYLPFIARAIALAITDFPKMNASVEGDSLRIHSLINLGIAVDLNFEGLVVPVVKDCRSKTVAQIAKEIRALSIKARDRKLGPDDFAGGTYTISNSGPFGTHITAPVINQPQIGIMSTDGIKKRPVVVESELGDTIAIRPVGILAQSFDHRAIDGAYSAAFLNRVREILCTYNWAAEV
ncbi:MAG: 2-oxo acid dehydrogenase subunit E2 [Acidiferrobacterales bacterium]|nr:2-oxo acid dehydrogenase subunit E2 [Acidiferrobacterales bacterium]